MWDCWSNLPVQSIQRSFLVEYWNTNCESISDFRQISYLSADVKESQSNSACMSYPFAESNKDCPYNFRNKVVKNTERIKILCLDIMQFRWISCFDFSWSSNCAACHLPNGKYIWIKQHFNVWIVIPAKPDLLLVPLRKFPMILKSFHQVTSVILIKSRSLNLRIVNGQIGWFVENSLRKDKKMKAIEWISRIQQ